ncbi:MAG: hypothetical protein A7316_02675 [Candidatus Altiarchaeales archaeon WOR_SM1_86-2]|nr:MAG: hypothetical protein A7316_02675 [Candidatus Altiarchaeales archaeon WOR_SM1_86-2]
MTLNSDIEKSFIENEIIGLIIPSVKYEEILIMITDILSKNYDKILYISINKPCESLVSGLKKRKIDTDRFHFIDCITRTKKNMLSTENCTYISSPGALYEIHYAILDVLRKQEIDAALIDSPSSLLRYYEHMDVLKFMHLLTTELIVSRCKGIFPFRKESARQVRRSIEMFADKVIDIDAGSEFSV